MRQRNEWLAWAATAVGSLGLVGLASAQSLPEGEMNSLLAEVPLMDRVAPSDKPEVEDVVRGTAPISDDGWSVGLPVTRQLVIARRGAQELPVRIDVFNELGQVVEHIDWVDAESRVKPLALDALLAGRYVVRVTSGERSEVVRFRKE